jgi:hypothetical protein
MAIPEFILRKLRVPGNFHTHAEGFSFVLNSTFAPAALTGMALEVDGPLVPPGSQHPRRARSGARAGRATTNGA